MISTAICKKGKSNLVFVEGNLNGQAFNATMNDHSLPFIRGKYGGKDDQAIYSQDNSPAL